MSEHSGHDSGHRGVHYEGTDAQPGGIVRIGLMVAGVVLLTLLVLRPLLSFLASRLAAFDPPPAPLAAEPNRRAPEPRLQERPFEDVTRLRAAEQPFLDEYGWVDEKAGRVHIPVGEALKIVARRGLPARPQPKAEAAPGQAPTPAPPPGGHP